MFQWTPKLILLPMAVLVMGFAASSKDGPVLSGKASTLDHPPFYAQKIEPITRTEVRLAPVSTQKTSPSKSGACSLDYIKAHESGGNYGAVSSSGKYRGAYQFDQSTWESNGGTGDPATASPEEQDRIAAATYARRGSQPWSVCH